MLFPTRKTIRPSSALNVVFDGNSLFTEYGTGAGKSVPTQTAGMAPLLGSGATVINFGVNGQTWADMDANASDVDGAFVAGKTNVLIAWETTNEAGTGYYTAAQTIADARSYVRNRLLAHPGWILVLMTALPGQNLNSQAETLAMNSRFDEVNAYFQANYRAMGARALLDVRAPGSPFRLTSYTPADFDVIGSLYAEPSGRRLHLNAAGAAVVARMIAQTLRRLPAR